MLALWLIVALTAALKHRPGSKGRLKAAAMQLLPPVLDALHARWLSGLSDRGRSTDRLQLFSYFNSTLVRTCAAILGALRCGPCLCRA